ncbi:MAG: hypothetical protein RLY78_3375 [Pseudomonadota bacterium]
MKSALPPAAVGWTPDPAAALAPGDSGFSLWGDTVSPAGPALGVAGAEVAPAGSAGLAGAALPRVLRTYVIARAALGLGLLAAPIMLLLAGTRIAWPVVALSAVYAVQAVLLSVWPQLRGPAAPASPARHWLATVGVDLLVFSLLRLLEPSDQLNYAALLVLPTLMAGVLMPRRLALGVAALVVLLLLGSVLSVGGLQANTMASLSQAGLAGAGFFAIALLASELAQRLAGEEASARSHLALARQQTLLNQVVIEEMSEGVLVVDRQGVLRAINPAAERLLGLVSAQALLQPMSAQAPLRGLQVVLGQAFAAGHWPESARELAVLLPDGSPRTLVLRARFTRRVGLASDGAVAQEIGVIFLEDARAVQARARQDKLAAMGRMSAGIAHEIRNPLAAISQANALLLEDELLVGTPQRLARIVADNAQRLRRIVDDVLTTASLPLQPPSAIDLGRLLPLWCEEWCQAADDPARARQRLSLQMPSADAALTALFDAEHLRRVLVNLLDNAGRHASQDPAAVQVQLRLHPQRRRLALSVASDGERIDADTERHLFEPFFSTRSRGTGLGLYICRELCARHGATIDYLPATVASRHPNLFRIVLRQPPDDAPTDPSPAAARSPTDAPRSARR